MYYPTPNLNHMAAVWPLEKNSRWEQFLHTSFDLWILLEMNSVKSKPLSLKVGPKYIWVHKQQ